MNAAKKTSLYYKSNIFPGCNPKDNNRKILFAKTLILLTIIYFFIPVIKAEEADNIIKIAQPEKDCQQGIPSFFYLKLNKISTDFITHLAQANNWKVTYIPVKSTVEAINKMQTGDIDILPIFNKNIQINSRKIVLSQNTIFQLNATLYTNRKSGINFLKDFNNKNIVTPLTGVLYDSLLSYLKNNSIKAKIIQVNNDREALNYMLREDSDALATIDFFIDPLLHKNKQLEDITNSGYSFVRIPLAIAGSEKFLIKNPKLFAKINYTLNHFTTEKIRTLKSLYSQTLESDERPDKSQLLVIVSLIIILGTLLFFLYSRRTILLNMQHILYKNVIAKKRLTAIEQELNEIKDITSTMITARYRLEIKTGHFTGDDNFFLILVGEVRDYLTYQEVLDHLVKVDFSPLFKHGRNIDSQNGLIELEPVIGRVYDAENNLRYIKIYSKSYYNNQGELKYRNGVIVDITEEKLNELALQVAHNDLSIVQKFAKMATWEVSLADINHLHVSKEFFNIIGLNPSTDNKIHRSLLEMLFDKENYDHIQQFYFEFETKGITSFDLVLPIITLDTAEKKYIHICSTANKLQLGEQKNAIISGFIQDITERHKEQARAENTNKMKALGRLAGRVAHDFNNQLYGILGFSEMIQNEEISNTAREYLEYVILSAEQASNLIKKLLHFSRSHSEELEDINLNEITENVLSSLNHIADPEIKLKQVVSDNTITILGDYTEIKSSLFGLGINAVNAVNAVNDSDKEKIITFSITKLTITEETNNEIDLNPGDYAVISVKDNGCGIDTEKQHKILEPFYSSKENTENTGNDLATIREIARSMGGTLTIQSKINVGTEIQLYLPRIKGKNLKLNTDITNNFSITEKNILIVDMDKSILRQFKFIFEKWNCFFKLENNSEKALKEFLNKKIKYDIIILDMFLPSTDGINLYEKILKIAPEAKVILTNGFYDKLEVEQAYQKGIAGFIKKPITQELLFKTISEILNNEK